MEINSGRASGTLWFNTRSTTKFWFRMVMWTCYERVNRTLSIVQTNDIDMEIIRRWRFVSSSITSWILKRIDCSERLLSVIVTNDLLGWHYWVAGEFIPETRVSSTALSICSDCVLCRVLVIFFPIIRFHSLALGNAINATSICVPLATATAIIGKQRCDSAVMLSYRTITL